MCSFVHRHFQMCMTLYLLRQHRGNRLSRASAGSSVGCCIQRNKQHIYGALARLEMKLNLKSQKFWKSSVGNYDTHLTFLVSIHYTDPQYTVSIAHAEARRVHIYNHNQRCMSDFSDKTVLLLTLYNTTGWKRVYFWCSGLSWNIFSCPSFFGIQSLGLSCLSLLRLWSFIFEYHCLAHQTCLNVFILHLGKAIP